MSLYFIAARALRPLEGRPFELKPCGEACLRIFGSDLRGSMWMLRKLALCW